MSSGIAFPRQFNFQHLANNKKLSATPNPLASSSSGIGSNDDDSETIGGPVQALAPVSSVNNITTSSNPFFRKPSILSNIPPTSSPTTQPAPTASLARSSSFVEEVDDEVNESEKNGKSYSSKERSSRSSRSSRSGGSSRSGKSAAGVLRKEPAAANKYYYNEDSDSDGSSRSDQSSRQSSRRSSRRSSRSSRSSHSRSSQPFRDAYDVQMENVKSEPMTREEYRRRQVDLIMSLRQMKEDGIPVDDDVRLEQTTPLEKLEFAYEYSKRYVIRQSTFNSFQRYLVMSSQMVELGNKLVKAKTGKGAELDGWSNSVMMNMPQYNYSLQRLAEKYSGPNESSPEVELAMALGWSAFSFHLAKKASIDPNMAQEFMTYMQNRGAGPATEAATGPAIPTPVSHPMGLRPPLGQNTRVPTTAVPNRLAVDSDTESETTEEVRI